jgi:predicted nucleotidyltransferase
MDKDIIEKIKELAAQARVYFDFEKVIVYGSYSNKTNRTESDIDVAFFVREISPNHWDLSAKLYELVDKIDVRIEPVIISEKDDRSGFARNIIESGFVIA